MPQQIKRPLYLLFSLEEQPHLEMAAFLRGEISVTTKPGIVALSLLTGSKQLVSHAEFRFLASLPAKTWCSIADLEDSPELAGVSLEDLMKRGLLLDNGPDPQMDRMRRHDEFLDALRWHPYAALLHFMDRGSENAKTATQSVDIAALADTAEADASEFVRRHGPPPESFHRYQGSEERIELPVVEKHGGLFDALSDRKTIRAFDPGKALKLQDLTILLRYVFGCHGYAELDRDVVLLHKTSPSGGSLHPIEAYPLILNAEGLATGLYHYDVHDHALALVRSIDIESARELAVEFSNGQKYAGTAQVLVILTARFFRNYWKYRRRSRTYSVLLMDAGHLSQTFYLVAAELGLGAFYTAAINGPQIEKCLGLEAPEEGALGICGCGIQASDTSTLGLDFKSFVPREKPP